MAYAKATQWLVAALTAVACRAAVHASEDWPMYRGDAARSAYTTNRVPAGLQLVWRRPARHRPSPAWSAQPRLAYDHTYHPVLAGGLLFFGSSTDHKAYALDAATGRTVWTFFTDAPIRVAPAVSGHGVYVGSDDGVLYCLDVKSGKLKWKVRAAPQDDRIMGNDRLISRWPVRGGPAVRDGIVYFAAGIWPTEGVYVYALDARDGKVIWRNDTVGSLVSDKPRAGRNVKSGPAAQGHLAVGDGVLVVPTGRGAPAVFDLANGSLKHFHHALYVNKASGGTKAAVLAGGQAPSKARPALTGVGDLVVCGENYPLGRTRRTRLCTPDDGRNVAAHVTAANADHPKMIVTGTSSGLAGFAKNIVEKERRERDGKVTKYLSLSRDPIWKCKTPFAVRDLVATESLLVVGGDGEIAVLEIDTRKVLSRAKVAGKVQSLAVANNCVYAATEDGAIYCFSESGSNRSAAAEMKPTAPGDTRLAAIAKNILHKTKLTRGYCLDIGCGEGELAYELAIRSDLYVYGVDTDVQKITAARALFDRLGLYGTRATFLHVDDLDKLPFTGRFAELVVSSKALTEAEGQALSKVRPALTGVGAASLSADEVRRMLCPYLGVSCLGYAGELAVTPRGPVKGAGNWTHFYADAHSSYCGTDTALRGPLELLWFRDTDYEMANRHSMSSPTMVEGGYMVMPGMHGVRVANVYNGRPVWQHDIAGLNFYPGGFSYDRRKLSGNMCVADGKVYVRHLDYCRCLDIRTGEMLGEWKLPGDLSGPGGGNDRRRWGYVACKDGVLYGSVANDELLVHGYPPPGSKAAERTRTLLATHPQWVPNHHHPDSTTLFAMDAATGKTKWIHKAEHSIRNTAIAIGDGALYFIDKPITVTDDYRSRLRGRTIDGARLAVMAKALADKRGTTVEAELDKLKNPRGRIVALDSRTGKVKWRSDETVGLGDMLSVSTAHNVLVTGGDVGCAVFAADTGKIVWKGGARGRPMVYGKELRFGSRVVDLMTGETIRTIPGVRGSYCTPILGSPNLIAFRVGVVGYVDLTGERGTEYFGGIRPGCYVDMTPAGGLLVMSDGASGCTCSYLNQCTIALQPRRPKRRP